jgi:hypothetical protein
MLLLLAALWGSSFMFIEIALRDLAPSTLILLRMLSGAAALAVYVALAKLDLRAMRAYVWPLALLGADALKMEARPESMYCWPQAIRKNGIAVLPAPSRASGHTYARIARRSSFASAT